MDQVPQIQGDEDQSSYETQGPNHLFQLPGSSPCGRPAREKTTNHETWYKL